MITVYYDDQCRLCSKEIKYYQRISKSHTFRWRGISSSTEELKAAGISLTDSLKRLHAVDNNTTHIGVDAFILIWNQLKGWKILASMISLPFIKPIIIIAYNHFADWRFKRLSHCKLPQDK